MRDFRTLWLEVTPEERAVLLELLGGELRMDRPSRTKGEWDHFEHITEQIRYKLLTETGL